MASQQEHAQARAALKTALIEELRRLLRLLDPARLADTLAGFTDAVVALLTQYGKASAELGTRRYEDLRSAAGVTSRFSPAPAEPAPPEQIESSISWAVHAKTQDEQGRQTDPTPEEIQQRVEGAAVRMVRQPERETIAQAVTDDREAIAWARVPTGATTCYFCALMCSRGAVYKSRETAGARNARGKRNKNAPGKAFLGEGEFKFHDHCDCDIVPVYAGQDYEPSEQVQAWDDLYAASGASNLKEFRRAYDGR